MKKLIYMSLCVLTCMFGAQMVRACDAGTRSRPCCPQKDTCCTRLQCREIISDFDVLLTCEPIILTCGADGSTIINEPGIYRLCSDLTCNITINSSQVVIDLNGHALTGTITTAPLAVLQDITIRNGVIMVPTILGDAGASIFMRGLPGGYMRNVLFEDLAIYPNGNPAANQQEFSCHATGLDYGLYVIEALHVVISRVYIEGAQSSNIFIENAENVTIESSNFVYSCGSGGLFAAVNGLVAIDSNFFNNQIDGLQLNSSNNVSLENCFAQNNGRNGFYISSNTLAVFKECQATGNGQNGFIDTVGFASTNSYVSCFARANGTNYNPAAAAPFNPFSVTAAGISYWYNTFAP